MVKIMEYIKKDELVQVLTKMIEARAKKKNCSRQVMSEYETLRYILRIVEQMETKNE